jgi:hypothetical protein
MNDEFKHVTEYCEACDEVVELYQVNSIGSVRWYCVKCDRMLDQLYHDGPYQEDY